MAKIRWLRIRGSHIFLFIIFTALVLVYFDLRLSTSGKMRRRYGPRMRFRPSEVTRKLPDNRSLLEPVFHGRMFGNYEPLGEPPRKGLGEGGVAVDLGEDHEEAVKASVAQYGFNIHLSDMISLDRRIKDTRPVECKYWHYPSPDYLPKASVIIVYFNEGWSVIARTIHSVINTSPPALLHEIILVDDGSTYPLHENLTKYASSKWRRGLVKTMRNEVREGLIRARVQGAQMATGDAIVILDAHCECVKNWLPPLLTRIALNRRALAIPIVDGIDWKKFEHRSVYGRNENYIGIWEWGFLYKETPVPSKEAKKHTRMSEPYWSPTHAGGLLAIDRQWFFELGGYDSGLMIWGGEQYELSFKVWLCGGIVEWVPCSHVAHIYRGPRSAYFPNPRAKSHQTERNHLRLSAIWMDEYKKYYRIREPATTKLDFGDISEQLQLKKRLECKSFDWFMQNIAYEALEKYPPPPDNVGWGELRNEEHNVCMDQMGVGFGGTIGVGPCQHQLFRLNTAGEISSGEHCFRSADQIVKKHFCLFNHGWNPVGEWQYNNSTLQVRSISNGRCLETDGHELFLSECNGTSGSQKWKWRNFYYS